MAEIDMVKQKLHDEINKCSLQLKEVTEYDFRDFIDDINKNKKMILDAKKKKNYQEKFIKTILELKDIGGIMRLSKVILRKVGAPNKTISMANKVLSLKLVELNPQYSTKDCISAIKNVGCIMEKPNANFENFKKSEDFDSNGYQEQDNFKRCLWNDSESKSDYKLCPICACCNQWSEILIKCDSCNRDFHHNCHIPALSKEMYNRDPLQSKWECTICQDITAYSKALNQKDLIGEIPVDNIERVVMERILMEIYCDGYDSEHFRKLLDKERYACYYEIVARPLSLNNIKTILESEQSYASLIDFLKDLKHVFSMGELYYAPFDLHHKSAKNLQLLLKRLINRWIPKLKDDYRLN